MSLHGKRVVVMGLGRFGGGVGVSRFLVSRGAKVLVTDTAPPDQLRASLAQLADLPIDYRLGEHRIEDFTAADLVVVNPAVDPRQNIYLRAAAEAGVPTTSEIRLLTSHLPNRNHTIGITGSAGKSTVTAMIGHILQHARDTVGSPSPGRVFVGGNLGGSLLPHLDTITPDDWVVLELSSFMLEGLAVDRWSPHIAVLTNLAPNHLDRHGSMEAYARAKQAIFDHQQAQDMAILGPIDSPWIQPHVSRTVRLDHPAAGTPVPDLPLPGEHNRLNAQLAVEATAAAGIDRATAAAALATFHGLPHRLQLVAERGDVRYFNDSKATTPDAAMLAIAGFPPGTVHVILGGYDKGSDLTAIAQLARRHCRCIYTIGATGDRIAALAAAAPGDAEILPCHTLDNAVRATADRIHAGDVVLLSPGCASYDQFDNYESRGHAFTQAVLLYTGEGAPPPRAQSAGE